ncbi:TRAP transporter large permease [Pigmentiphaga litoralis]|uniref:TRAP transporter large permease protein n=1 Tax=Pigmentiphaga litoralis TaxID=516702 RepID=A0A7Y9IU55_9BURK|nr:TRAP transporter large permease [Pigmentiphaga litoralis]NYE23382.1 C4-dicarboxylate transporter DctM subunit [Pigmentiphaga litoralis]NYE83004.1 C4-dicarboxylate transporter DctM subunit [Pigmentiphaga litoralis]
MIEMLVYLAIPIVLLVAGTPIYVVLLAAGMAALGLLTDYPLGAIHTAAFGSLDSFPLLAIPLFIFAGDIMGQGGIARRLVDWVLSIIGGVRGSLGIATITSAELFGTMSGSSVGCVAAVGRLLYPTLCANGYPPRFAASLIASAGAVAVIIPPSIAMIIYGIVAQQSIPKLFMAGIVPGILIGLLVVVYIAVYARIERVPLMSKARWATIATTSRAAVFALAAPVFILGGIYGGIFTPTEAAGVACVYSMLVSRYIYRELTWKQIWAVAQGSTRLVAQILVIVAAAGVYAWMVTTSGFPVKLVELIQSIGLGPIGLLLIFNIVLLLMGSVLEPPATILMLAPLVMPLVTSVGIDPIHFGIIMTVNLAIGMFLPPFGLNLFAAQTVFNMPLSSLYRGVVPFMVLYLFALLLITYIPGISLGLMHWVYR